MHYQTNRLRARTINNDPSLTDQSQAQETDINVIVGRYGVTGRVPGAPGQPMSGDFTELPTNLRDMIEMSRSMKAKRAELPKQLAELPIEELLALTPEAIQQKLTPPPAPTPPEPPKE